MRKLREQLKRQEGLSLDPYIDTQGVWTVGYGHTGSISLYIAEEMLTHDMAQAVSDFYRLPKCFQKLNVSRKRVIVNMLFNMGLGRFLTFKKMIRAIENRDFAGVAAEMIDSKWARQVGYRAVELAEIMRHGGEK